MRRPELPPGAPLALHLIHSRPGLTVSELSRAAGQAKSNTSVLVDQLSGVGLVEKRADPSDQRLARVYATPLLEEHWTRMHRMMDEMMGELLADLTEDERTNLVTALRQLREAARRKGWWKE